MPLYEYRCEACSRLVEVLQKVSDKPLRKCESCGGRLRKAISTSGFVLKGSGWYVTDYKSGGTSSGSDKGDKSADKPAEKSSEKPAKSESAASSSDTANSSKAKRKD